MKVGLEVHQQIGERKMFCGCDARLTDDVTGRFSRYLRVARSEMGEVDPAAREAMERGHRYIYERTPNTCLVEEDEEPPHPLREDILLTGLCIARMFHAEPVDEVHVMRKIVIDGSNTSGFQRTALIATGGHIDVEGKRISIPTICLEEEAARKIAQKGPEITYRLDRLGICLIEVATGPDIGTPREAERVARRIGMMLRSTGRVRRGLGTIREDLNISVPEGARVEVKGVQDLRSISTFVKKECERQERLLKVCSTLRERGVRHVEGRVFDLTDDLGSTTSRVLRSALKRGGRVLGTALRGFAGLLGELERGGPRALGPELASYAKTTGVPGIFHSDELPGYGITAEDVHSIVRKMGLGEMDAFVLVAGEERISRHALERVVERANMAISGVPGETRDPRPDGSTSYSRPLPGRARMYPETDILPIPVTRELIERAGSLVPEDPEMRVARMVREHALPEQVVRQIVEDGWGDDVESLISMSGADAGLTARVYTQILPELEREGLPAPSRPQIGETLRLVARGVLAREGVSPVLALVVREDLPPDAAMRRLGLGSVSEADLDAAIDELVRRERDLILQKGERSHAALMGELMREFRGKVNGSLISERLRARLRKGVDP